MNYVDGPILLVEDNPTDVLLIRRSLGKANITTPLQVVGDGEVALCYLSGEPPYADRRLSPLPAIILLDLKLPRLSGLEVLQWLRQQPVLKRLPVVVLTTSREAIDLRRAYDLGINSYLIKPVGTEALIHMLHQIHNYWFVLNEPPDLAAH